MYVYSIDIETTGLNPGIHGITEFAAIRFNLFDKSEPIQSFVRYLNPEGYVWSNYCLRLHKKWIEHITDRLLNSTDSQGLIPICHDYHDLKNSFDNWLYKKCDVLIEKDRLKSIVATGKNFDSFDRQFLLNHGFISSFAHRSIDVGALFIEKGDIKPPDLRLCKERALARGCQTISLVEVSHAALDDAIDVVNLLQFAYEAK